MGEKFLKSPLVHVIFIALLGILAYFNTFDVPFVFDDRGNIVENPAIKSFRYFASPSEIEGIAERNLLYVFKNRYVAYLTFALNYRVHGLDVAGYHVVNLAIHIINALLVYWLVRITFRTPYFASFGGGARMAPVLTAFFSALVFVAHPVQTQAVTYIVQRISALVALFYVLSLIFYIKARLEGRAGRQCALYAISLVSALLAMKTKENAFTLPLMVALYEFMFFKGSIRRRAAYLSPILLTLLVIPLTLMDLGGDQGGGVENLKKAMGSVAPKDEAGVSWWVYLLTQCRVLVTYLRLLVLPINLNFDYDYPVYGSLTDLPVLSSLMFLLLIAGLGAYLACGLRSARAEMRLAAFGIFWFFMSLLVESGVIPIADVIFEHRVYLPSVGAFAAMASGSILLLGAIRNDKARAAALAALVLVPIMFAYAAHERNGVWRDEIIILKDVVRKSPRKSRGYNFLGTAYLSRGMTELAIDNYLWALELDPENSRAHNNLGIAYRAMGQTGKAMEQYQVAVELDPEDSRAHNNLGIVYSSMGQTDKAMEHYREALRLSPGFAMVHSNLAFLYLSEGMVEDAIRHFRAALTIDPDSAEAHFNMGMVYFREGKMEEARLRFEEALRLDPEFSQAEQFLWRVLKKGGGKRNE
jgi:tetratricopeptide (TPR) repeat protein